ncbi:M14 family metallopeptidase [Caproiciproducens faecalis]|uniref:Peptidoglycan-binding protein n=1 Tax=Caproiciproducens faecalis TaxID=2820301 RepID=A0ABS7DRM7_9FIRM|nr:M14 family metallopeptidase [Caproiciproducens faecalis]MBW7573955.1 peptidoglycan-binding protein [Caproiciproducens faecalis]
MRTLQVGMSGTDVMEIQAMLQKIGYNPGPIDGNFGQQMRRAVIQFQRAFGLSPDGVIGPSTYSIMEKYLLGYDLYRIKPGDTFYSIARRYHTSLPLLLGANPGLDASSLSVGQQIVVPYGMDVVNTNIDYTYEILERNIRGLKARYPFLEVGIAGMSVLGRNLYFLKLGTGPNQVFYNAAHHSLEWITSPLLMKFTENFLYAYTLEHTLGNGYNPREIWSQSSIYIMPMVNPDGIDLVLNGLQPDNPYYLDLIAWNKGSTDFSQDWQANNRGVDLNHNYNAAWQESKAAEAEYGITGPGPTRYSGPFPVSEPETKTVVNFTQSHDFRLVIAYHTQGQVIYWNFKNMAPPEGRMIGEEFAAISGYRLDETIGIASYAGYKDWFIQDYRRPGYTIEVGLGQNPIPISQFNTIYQQNIGILLHAATV